MADGGWHISETPQVAPALSQFRAGAAFCSCRPIPICRQEPDGFFLSSKLRERALNSTIGAYYMPKMRRFAVLAVLCCAAMQAKCRYLTHPPGDSD